MSTAGTWVLYLPGNEDVVRIRLSRLWSLEQPPPPPKKKKKQKKKKQTQTTKVARCTWVEVKLPEPCPDYIERTF